MAHLYTRLLAMTIIVGSHILAYAQDIPTTITLTDREGWFHGTKCPEDLSVEHQTIESEKMRLSFFGWSPDTDYPFSLSFPTDKTFRRCILEYEMSGFPRPADWDQLTEIQVYNPDDDLWYELTRVITPYGGSFNSTWSKTYYFDATEFLPLLQKTDETKFKIYYGGFDATEQKAHAVTLRFHLLDGQPENGPVLYTHQVYDSFRNGNNGYRAWAYGVQGHSIEDAERLGQRTIHIPENVHSAWLRVCFTGHGQEAYNESGDGVASVMPSFPNRPGYKVKNPAEFDENTYTIILNGEKVETTGKIWEVNTYNYAQAGTYKTNRAGWGPGKPGNVHWWYLENLPSGQDITLDIDLEEYISNRTAPNGAYVANYYVSATLFGLERAVLNGIHDVKISDPATVTTIHDLQGRRLTAIPHKGLYILNGKKLMK